MTDSEKRKVYFSGSIRGGRDDYRVYGFLIAVLKEKYDVLTEHIGLPDLEKFEESNTDEGIYARDRKLLDGCDFVLAECTTPSLGVGYELAYAESIGKPVTVLFDLSKNRKLSAMIAGNAYFRKIYYSGEEELRKIALDL